MGAEAWALPLPSPPAPPAVSFSARAGWVDSPPGGCRCLPPAPRRAEAWAGEARHPSRLPIWPLTGELDPSADLASSPGAPPPHPAPPTNCRVTDRLGNAGDGSNNGDNDTRLGCLSGCPENPLRPHTCKRRESIRCSSKNSGESSPSSDAIPFHKRQAQQLSTRTARASGRPRQGHHPPHSEPWGRGGRTPPGRAELPLPVLKLRPLRKQRNQGVGGSRGSPAVGKQESIQALPPLAPLFPARLAAGSVGADQEEADAPGQASVGQVAFPASSASAEDEGARLSTHSVGAQGSWPALGEEVAASPASYKGHRSRTRETGSRRKARHPSPHPRLSSSYWRPAGSEVVLSLPRPGSPCGGWRRGSLRGLCRGGLDLRGRARGGYPVWPPLRCLDPVSDLRQRLAHLTDAAGQLRHGLADGTHAVRHVPVHGHQLLAELLEDLGLPDVGMEELPVKARAGRAGVRPRGPAGSLGLR